jgi:hypothetical protein
MQRLKEIDPMKVKFENAPNDVLPKCPHCEQRLERVWVRKHGLGFWQQKQMLICPKCETFLGYGSVRFFG